MSERGDELVEKGADHLDELADRTATSGGIKAKVADELADDAAFLRKLKPSLIAARIRRRAPTDAPPGGTARTTPSDDTNGRRAKPTTRRGPNPFVVIGAATAAGVLLAKIIDWRGHAHPRR
jgi:hypothetical protein